MTDISFGEFTDKILQLANQTFSVMHHKFLKETWGDNKTTHKLHHNQTATDWQNGRYEVYIPTRDSTEFNLEYSRIAIQVLPEVSNTSKYPQAYALMNHQIEPLGKIESELLVLVAYKQDKPGIVRGFKHRAAKGYFTGVFVSRMRSPELIWKRILDHIGNFFQKRLDGFMRSLGFETWVWKWAQKDISLTNMGYILERFSFTLRQSLFTLMKVWQHIRDSMKLILHEIGVQNVMRSKTANQIRSEIDILTQALKQSVAFNLQFDKGVRYLHILETVKHG